MTLLQRLHEDRAPLLADGAMGTLLHLRGLPIDTCFDQLNVTRPDSITDVHRAYVAAGADVLETNTFGANRLKLAEHGLETQVGSINRAGVLLARIAVQDAARTVYIAGSVGPLGVGVQPFGRLKPEDARAIYAEQIAALVDTTDGQAGVDGLIFETFTDVAELLLALATARDIVRESGRAVAIFCHATFAPDDRTLTGYLPGRVARELRAAGADVIGVNCGAGPAQISRVLQAMRTAAPDALVSALPNAGFPETINGRTMYPAGVEYFADYALTFRSQGARLIGGCCGTTPEHIAAMRAALDAPPIDAPSRIRISVNGNHTNGTNGNGAAHDDDESLESIPRDRTLSERPSELAAKLRSGQFVISVEMNPPRSHNLERTLAAAELLRDAGADVLNIADSPTARMRVSPWAVCQLLQTRIGMETILHFPTRGRNLLRIQGDLLGAHALGIRNVFVCMGDPTRIGDYPDAMDNYDIVPSGLIRLVAQRMNVGVDQAGNSINGATQFTVGCALNMGATDADKEIDVLLKKLDAGANFALGQPVFDAHLAERFLRRYEQIAGQALDLPVLMGVMPLHSVKHAQFLNNEIPGITIPDAILKRIADAGDDAPNVGVEIAGELLSNLRGMVQGAYIIPSFGKYELAARLIQTVTTL
ncbi:MAG: bifunctional homocysteine S-methyltransferase/methylenetetrahydrofolate reductase [Chloroflexota bacterium]|nr:bifunctional homocysteine S-methyltransferase/methylenetetrahydrofolate reductase [Chloroflexota bacterium]